MKLIKLLAAVFVLFSSLGAARAAAQHNHGGGHTGGGSAGASGGHDSARRNRALADAGICPLRSKAFGSALKNLENGVEITLTAKDAGNIARLRELAARHFTPGEELDENCPAGVPDARTAIESIDGGVRIAITARAAAAVKAIQVTALYACKKDEPGEKRVFKTYVCPMGEYQSSKSGKCPQCGMDLVEKQ